MSFEQSYADRDVVQMSTLSSLRSRLPFAGSQPFDSADEEEAKQGLLSHLLPEPSSHRAQSRTISTGIVVLFFCFVLFKLSLGGAGDGDAQGWLVQGYYVDVGDVRTTRLPGNGATTGQSSLVEVPANPAHHVEVVAAMTKPHGFDKSTSLSKSQEINRLIDDSVLSEYQFHSTATIPTGSRVIMIGTPPSPPWLCIVPN